MNYSDSDSDNDAFLTEAQRAAKYERWLRQGRKYLRRRFRSLRCRHSSSLWIDDRSLILLDLEPDLLEDFQETLISMPPGWMQEFELNMFRSRSSLRRNPTSIEALLATATRVVNIMSSLESLRRLTLARVPASISSLFLTSCSQLRRAKLRLCPLTEAGIRAIFSIQSLRDISIEGIDLQSSELVNAFCRGVEASFLTHLSLNGVEFLADHEAQVATALARSKSLEHLEYSHGASEIFCDHYCAALSNNVDTKLERLHLVHWLVHEGLCLVGDHGPTEGVDNATAAKIRNLLKWNVQRKTCPPLFAAIGNAETDAERKRCLVGAMEAVDIPVVFEYITTNENNLIELIQRLGRSRKRQRED